jgi:hypothetical protein
VPQDEKSSGGIVQTITNNLSAFFRHLFPGVLIMGAAYLAHKSWFPSPDSRSWQSWQHVLIAAAIALAVGNIWFAINRYVIHQSIDWVLYLIGVKGPSKSQCGYFEDLGKYVADSQCISAIPEQARQHIVFRASSVLLLYIAAEIGVLFSLWNEPGSLFAQYRWPIIGGSAVVFVAGIWQQVITRYIDDHIIEFGRKRDPLWKSD